MDNRSFLHYILPIILILLSAAVLITWRVTYKSARAELDEKYAATLGGISADSEISLAMYHADRLVAGRYIGTPDSASALHAALGGYIGAFGDPYAYYMSSEEYEAVSVQTDGDAPVTFIGAELTDTAAAQGLVIGNVYDDTPASYAGLAEGDTVTSVNDIPVTAFGLVRTKNMLCAGRYDSAVRIGVTKANGETQTLTVSRTAKNLPTVSTGTYGDGVGVLRVHTFADTTPDDFKNAVASLSAMGCDRFVVDLRGTSGDSLAGTLGTLDFLLPEGNLVLIEDRGGVTNGSIVSDTTAFGAPMTLVTDGFTAGLSELFAAILAEYGRCETVGEKTYGKGYYTELVPLGDGGAVILSVGEYRTPAGKSIQGVGVEPTAKDALDAITEETDDVYLAAAAKLVGEASYFDPGV